MYQLIVGRVSILSLKNLAEVEPDGHAAKTLGSAVDPPRVNGSEGKGFRRKSGRAYLNKASSRIGARAIDSPPPVGYWCNLNPGILFISSNGIYPCSSGREIS